MSQNCFHALHWLCSVVHRLLGFAALCIALLGFALICFFFAPTDERYEALHASDVTCLYAGYVIIIAFSEPFPIACYLCTRYITGAGSAQMGV